MDHLPRLIRERILLYEWVKRDVPLVRRGNRWMGLCPFHGEKTPSFFVSEKRYHCFGCGVSGDLFDYVMERRGFSFKDALEELASYAQIPIPEQQKPFKKLYKTLSEVEGCFHDALCENESALAYLKSRQITEEILKEFSLGFGADLRNFPKSDLKILGLVSESGTNRFLKRLIFPIHNRYGQVVGFSGRGLTEDQMPKYYNTPETEFFHKRDILYGYHLARRNLQKDQSLIVVEGYFDVITLHQYGLKTAVGSMGTALSEEQIRQLWRHARPPILCFDGDSAGIRAAYQAIARMIPHLTGKQTFLFYLLPPKEDPDSFLRTYGVEAFSRLKPYPLVDILWQSLCQDYPLTPQSSPEQKAYFEDLWKDRLTPIQDSSLKRFYGEEFFKRQKNLFYKKKDQKPLVTAHTPLIKDLDVRILLVTIVNHPALLDDVIESLTCTVFLNPFMETLKNEVLCKNFENCKRLESESLYDVAPFAHFLKTDEEALKGWNDVWSRFMQKTSCDVQEAYTHTKDKMTQDAWERFKVIKMQYTKYNK